MKKCDVIFLFIDHVKLVPFHCYVLFTFDKLLLVPVECFTCFYFIFSFLPSLIPLFPLSDKIQVIIVCQVGNKKYTNILSLSSDLIQALVIHRTHWFSFLNLPSLFSSSFSPPFSFHLSLLRLPSVTSLTLLPFLSINIITLFLSGEIGMNCSAVTRNLFSWVDCQELWMKRAHLHLLKLFSYLLYCSMPKT